jgi:hypothetical protein
MRKMATVKNLHSETKRVIMHSSEDGVYLFSFLTLEDGPATGDHWYQTVVEADEACFDLYGIGANDWIEIGDPLKGCQQDWIAPVRVKGRNIGKPQWGTFERLEQDGVWREIPQSSFPHQ